MQESKITIYLDNELFNNLKEATKKYYDRVREIYRERASKKEEIISRLRDISEEDYIYKFKKELEEIRAEWKSIGFTGNNQKDLNDRYYMYLNDIKKKRIEEYEAFQRKMQEAERIADRKTR